MNLAQILYRYTSTVPPRNFNTFNWMDPILQESLVPEDMRKALLLAIPMIRSISFQMRGNYAAPDTQTDSTPKTEEDPSERIAALEKQIRTLADENKQMQNSLWKMQSENTQLNRKLEKTKSDSQADREELARLREILFAWQNPQQELPDPTISLPYETKERIIICGGHDSFIKQFSQLVTGNVRFLNTVRVNEELIRNASQIWIQTNAISHSEYYKVIDLCRRHQKAVHYFRYASARKCAEQIVLGR